MSKSLLKSTGLVSAMTMVSRVLGFIRDMLAAQIFGVGPAVDAFYIAFKIPNFMRSIFAEGSFSQAFVPVLSEYRQTRSPKDVKEFIAFVAGGLGLALLVVTILGELITPLIILISAPGLGPERFHLATEMLRITFPYMMLISLTAFSGAILNSYGNFSIPSVTPALLNICLITSALFLSNYFHVPIEAQAWGVLIAGFVQLAFQLPFLFKKGFLVFPRLNWKDPGVRKVLKLMVPAIFGASVVQISLLLNTIFASFLKVGSVTWLYYSDRLAYFPLGVFGVAIATVVLPHLSRKHSDKNPEQFKKALDWGVRINLLLGIPASIFLAIFAGPIITTLFQYGKFNHFDVIMTRESVVAYAVGLQAFMLVKLLSSSFYARQDIKTPVRYTVITLVINMILNGLLIIPLAHAGLALATSLASWINVSLLMVGLYRRGVYGFSKSWKRFLCQVIPANMALTGFLLWQHGTLQQWFAWSGHVRLTHLLIILAVAGIIYLMILVLLGFRTRDLLGHQQ